MRKEINMKEIASPAASSGRKNKDYLKTVIGISIFSALAYVVAFVCNIIPPVAGFLSLDAKDAVITIASFIYGPISGIIIAFIAAFIEFLTFSTTAWYGFVMNFASSAVFALTAALIYRFKRTLNGALIGLLCAVITTASVMLFLNRFVTPIYLFDYLKAMPEGAAVEYVKSILPTVLLPFNLAKSIMNASVAMLLYKPIVLALRRAKVASGDASAVKFNRSSVYILVIGAVALVVSISVLLLIW